MAIANDGTALLVIGGGPGGYVAAIRAGQLGIRPCSSRARTPTYRKRHAWAPGCPSYASSSSDWRLPALPVLRLPMPPRPVCSSPASSPT